MKTYQVLYTKIPTSHHDQHRAVVEAESPEDARKLVVRQLGDDRPGLINYVVESAIEYKPESIKGKIISMD